MLPLCTCRILSGFRLHVMESLCLSCLGLLLGCLHGFCDVWGHIAALGCPVSTCLLNGFCDLGGAHSQTGPHCEHIVCCACACMSHAISDLGGHLAAGRTVSTCLLVHVCVSACACMSMCLCVSECVQELVCVCVCMCMCMQAGVWVGVPFERREVGLGLGLTLK